MVLLCLYISLIALNLILKKSKMAYYSLLVYMWILYGWSCNTADWTIYVNRFNNYLSVSSRTEIGYTALMKFGHLLGFDYRMMFIFMSAIGLLLISHTIMRLSKNPGIALGLYAVFPFIMDVTQMRFFVAFSVLCGGYLYLWNYYLERKKADLIKWLLVFLLAINIHMSTIVCAVFLLPLFVKRRRIIYLVAGFDALLIFFSTFKSRIFSLIAMLISSDKASIVMEQASKYGKGTVYFVWYKTAFIAAGFFLIYLLAKYVFKISVSETHKKEREFVFDLNICIMVLIGLISVTTDFYRVQQAVVLINYIFFSNCLSKTNGLLRINKKNVVIIGIALIFAYGALYNLVLNSGNYNTVFMPVFYENVLLLP